MELDNQSLFGFLCTAVLIGGDPRNSPLPPAFGLIYEGAIYIGQPRETSLCNPLFHTHRNTTQPLVLLFYCRKEARPPPPPTIQYVCPLLEGKCETIPQDGEPEGSA
jgi:hypothetical protein